ncbi:hypothetical protein PUR59_04205 [Streptomyces sp. SP18ES09]|uniref:hypothetical protein n=1 Tax=Streptomyces sp. SP18ES09 TaxID=3002532 RepID=UPI002E776E52|nr:hypothetical protein [Streptomyces sp. SP18ES09]MEE1814223.1 hypothetical protein [Streptomyces sp. SP18ES09]
MGLKKNDRPVGAEDEQQVRDLHAQGLSRNEIARRMERSGRTISIIAARLQLSFDRGATEAATRARMADLAEKRSVLAEALTDDALRLSAQVWEPAVVFNFGGKDNTFEKRELPEPPAADKRALMAAATAAATQSLRLVPPVTETGEDDAKSMLGKIAAGLVQVWNEQQAADEGDGDAQ